MISIKVHCQYDNNRSTRYLIIKRFLCVRLLLLFYFVLVPEVNTHCTRTANRRTPKVIGHVEHRGLRRKSMCCHPPHYCYYNVQINQATHTPLEHENNYYTVAFSLNILSTIVLFFILMCSPSSERIQYNII
jgi:hypothetical protein